jgi:hypothetical protein
MQCDLVVSSFCATYSDSCRVEMERLGSRCSQARVACFQPAPKRYIMGSARIGP